jgi:hypothetical protein
LHPIAPYYTDFSLEHEFLLELLGESYLGRLRESQTAAAGIDWKHLFAITPTDLYACLGYKLAEGGLEGQCPAHLLKAAHNARLATAAQWLRLRFELHRLAAEFAQHDVDFVVLKGAALAFLAYPDSSLRSVSDIDILVRSGSLSQALEAIRAAGFRCPDRFALAQPMSLMEFALPGEEISLPLQKPGTRALIEIHTQLESGEPWFPVPIGRIWESIRKADLAGLKVWVLDGHEFLFHLVLHLARGHKFALGLRPLLDVHLWVKVQEKSLDWEWIASECVRRGYGQWAHLTLRIVRDTFGTQVPASFFEHVPSPPALDHLLQLAYEQIWSDRQLDTIIPPRLAITLSQPSVGAAISSLFKRLWPNRQQSHATVPPLDKMEGTGLAAVFRGVVNDFKVKLPPYARAWRNGRLSWSNLQKASHLERGRRKLEKLLANPFTAN